MVNWGGSVYTSADSGVTWTEQTNAGARNWRSVAANADGSKLTATDYGGYIYTSSNSGNTWTAQTGAGLRNWSADAINPSGTKIASADWGKIDGMYMGTEEGPATDTFDLGTLTPPSGTAVEVSGGFTVHNLNGLLHHQ